MSLISLARIKRRLGLDIDETGQDALLTELVDGAVAYVNTKTNRQFTLPEQRTEYLMGYGTRYLFLKGTPEDTGSGYDLAITEYSEPGTIVAVLATSTYQLRTSPRSAWVVRLGSNVWVDGYEYVCVYTTAGYAVDGLPDDIEEVIFFLVGLRFADIAEERVGGLKSETIGGYSYTRFGDADLIGMDRYMDILTSWREPVVA